MATLQDIIETVPALLDDASTSVFTPDFILPYVNTAVRKLASRLRSNSVRTVRARQEASLIVPAGTTRIGHDRGPTVQAPPNLIAASEDFTSGAGKWNFGPYDNPTVAGSQADPAGGTTATRWTFSAISAHQATILSAVTIPVSTANTYVTASIWMKTSGAMPFTATVYAGLSSTNETSTSLNVTSAWQQAIVTTGPHTTSASVPQAGSLRILFPVSGNVVVEVAFASITHTQEFLGYSKTAGLPLTSGLSPVLPRNFVEPDYLEEAKVGATNDGFYQMIGPTAVPNTMQSNSLGYWDWYGGEIHLLGATEDRQVRLTYWADLDLFQDPAIPSQPVIPDTSVNAISHLVCQYIATSRGQHELATAAAANAEAEIEDFINTELKMQQQQPQRRSPYRGQGRYDGYFRGYR